MTAVRLVFFASILVAAPARAEIPEDDLAMIHHGYEGDDYEWYLKKKHKKAQKASQVRIRELEAALQRTLQSGSSTQETLEERAAQLERENVLLRSRLATLGQDASKQNENLEDLKRRMEELQRAKDQSEKRAQQFRDLVAKFKSMVDAGKLQVEIRNGLMLVKLPDNILFDPGKTDLKPAGREAISQVAQILAGIEGRKFQVTGHTDNVPIRSKKFRSNWELSSARAVEVVKVMIAAGLDPARLSAAGYADQLPVAPNGDAVGRLQNRRIEVVVQPNLDELPQLDPAK